MRIREAFLVALLQSKSTFFHIAAHGSGQVLSVAEESDQQVDISPKDIEEFCDDNELDGPLARRFVTVSSCSEVDSSFAMGLHEHAGATAVIAPLGPIGFNESVLFAMMFYFNLLPLVGSMEKRISAEILSTYIDSFNRSKDAYLHMGGTGALRLDYWWNDEHVAII